MYSARTRDASPGGDGILNPALRTRVDDRTFGCSRRGRTEGSATTAAPRQDVRQIVVASGDDARPQTTGPGADKPKARGSQHCPEEAFHPSFITKEPSAPTLQVGADGFMKTAIRPN